MSGRLRACSSHQRTALDGDWQFSAAASAAAGAATGEAPADGPAWLPANVPGTVAGALRSAGRWCPDPAARSLDADEWWYRTRFTAAPAAPGEVVILGFDGLATLAEVRLNGRPLCVSDNMFVEHRCDVGALLAGDNELLIRFSPVDEFLKARRRRPRWRTPMVANQQLRWVRTTLLGRTPGWSPPAAPVGPWRPVWLERRRLVDLDGPVLRATVDGNVGRLALSCGLSPLAGGVLVAGRLIAERAGRRFDAVLAVGPAGGAAEAALAIPGVELWWPHTHGDPALYAVSVQLMVRDGGGEHAVTLDLGAVGFRTLRLERDSGRFEFEVNGRPVFVRGACWTPLDCIDLQTRPAQCRAALEQVRDAGMNMLRVPGPMVYETDEFLDGCDALGILLWQDLMFANMDYPAEDATFAAGVRAEAAQQLARLQARPALALVCGNSEGAQQAAMSGAPRECWAPPLFETDLAALARAACPDVPYCPSSTHGGAFPFQANAGVTSYYGVGAYLLPLADARRSEVRFASECLAFANVPEDETLALLAPQGQALRCHHPRWKERVPRDLGAGWDFDDVRDHYLARLFAVDPSALRYVNHDRYLRLARAVSGEVMAATFAEWRRAASACSGALILTLRDCWPGAGWGVIDATGLPKAAYYYLKRVLAPLAIFITDENTNGLMLHLANDGCTDVDGRLELQQFRYSQPVGGVAGRDVRLAARTCVAHSAVEWYDGFTDLSFAYRFGPASYDVLRASLTAADGTLLSECFHFPQGLPNAVEGDVGLSAEARSLADGSWQLEVRCRRFAQAVHADIPGCVAEDQYFHMPPNSTRTLRVRRRDGASGAALEGFVHALNAAAAARITVKQ